ncbi:hypothetical protein [Chroococcidiopsis sp. SAG 2025]|uniref:hypothetical protein n=1 Tax=Chroococcidiopsis sp. SAG 2025 TaxID=171389 RepID=UPI0029370600|nr:hypothetical protein [Chroococcidiopsis sp. SAG 2025]
MFRTLIIVTTTTVSSSLAKGRSLPTEIRVIRSFLGDKGELALPHDRSAKPFPKGREWGLGGKG